MSTLKDRFSALSAKQKRTVHLHLCENALKKWREFIASRGRIQYTETVCGTSQIVDGKLPEDALQSAHHGHDMASIEERYREPISAMQDDDIELLDHIEYAYYAVYNLFLKYARKEDVDDWLIVNQALSSETDEEKWHPLLQEAMTQAM